MLQEKEYHLKSVSPLLMHNGQLADPLNPFVKAMKIISGKRKKTDADLEELARLEFLGGLYMDKNGPIIIAPAIRGMIVKAAKNRREGQLALSGVFTVKNASLQYDGPRDADALWTDGGFTDRAIVRVGTSRVVRTRPIFREWEAVISVMYDDEVVSERQLDEWVGAGGSIAGFYEMRPQLGRFEVVAVADNGNYGTPQLAKVKVR